MLESFYSPVLFGQSLPALVFVTCAGCGLAWVLYVTFIRVPKPVVFHVCRESPSGIQEQHYTYFRNGKPALESGPLAKIAVEVRKASDALLISKENPPPFVIRFTHPSGDAHVERPSRLSKAILYEPLSFAERARFWSDYTPTSLSVAA